jgi:cold shock CspA family protein
MPAGQMLRWNSEKGFGFIKPDDGGKDLFCHASGLADGDGSVRDGDNVTFKIEFDDRKGKDRAVKVKSTSGGAGSSGDGRGRDRSPPPRGGRSRSRGGGGRSRSPPPRRGGRDRDSRSPPPKRGGGGGGGRGGGGGGGPGAGSMLRWNEEKGFGFIKPDKGDEDLFCHFSYLLDGAGSVRVGDRVTFVAKYDDKKGKLHALDVAVEGGGDRTGGGGGRGGDRFITHGAVAGTYYAVDENHGRKAYKRDTQASNGLDVMLYYWDEREMPAFCGWWCGPKIGGDQFWAYNPAKGHGPPTYGWRIGAAAAAAAAAGVTWAIASWRSAEEESAAV